MVRIEQVADGVVVLTLDDGKVNVLNLDVLGELTEGFREQAENAVVVTGAGRALFAGVDLRPVVERGRPTWSGSCPRWTRCSSPCSTIPRRWSRR